MAYAPPPAFSVSFADIGSLHIIEEGELALRVDGDPHVEHVSRGDVVLLPRGDSHRIGAAGPDAPGRPAGSAERSRSATRRRATCSGASRP